MVDEKIIIVSGAAKTEIKCKDISDECNKIADITIDQLSSIVALKCGVPCGRQKLIFKGKSLIADETQLSSIGIKNGSKIMLIGKKHDPEEEKMLNEVNKILSEATSQDKLLDDVIKEITELSKGFLTKEMSLEHLEKLQKKQLRITEMLTKSLEDLDALGINSYLESAKLKRKTSINKIQGFLERSDLLLEKITSEKSRVKS